LKGHLHKRFSAKWVEPSKAFEGRGRGEESPVMAYDGGEHFWGVVYDPATKRFSEPSFNGRI